MQQNQFSFTFVVFNALTITNGTTAPSATQGQAYSYQFTAVGGTAPYTWSATGLPAGMTLSSAGLLSGTPTAGGNFNVTVTVQDASN